MKLHRLSYSLGILFAAAACGGQAAAPSGVGEQGLTPTAPSEPTASIDLPISSRSFRMGTAGFIPSHYPDSGEEDWRAFFEDGAASYGGLFGVHVNPGDRPDEAGIPEQVKLAFEQVNGVEPYVAFVVNYTEGPFTEQRGQQLLRAAVATAARYQPTYLSMGVESNSFYLFQPDTFDLYVQYARQAYDEIKAVSPETRVMNNFQLERMRGDTALTGQEFEPHWELIDRLEGKIDLISFTVYPFLHYATVGEIPEGYLAEIRRHTDLPILITETGWPSRPTASGVTGSDQEQIDYLMKLIQQADDLELEAIIWVFPHDAEFGIAGGIFDHISLKHNDGSPKPAFAYWQAVNTRPRR